LEDGFIGTDDGSLVERLGLPVVAVEDSEDNVKITTPVDLELARILLQGRPR
jgi:2-C-methyl-D-erythritol 4-phosphate cytidylyltransferase